MSEAAANRPAIGYVRVSTSEQSTAMQREAMIAAGVPEGSIFEDTASGGTMARPGLRNAFKALRPGDVLLVWKMDRLGRNLLEVLKTIEKLQAMDVQIKSLTEPQLDATTPMGRLLLGVLGSIAQWERDLIRERTRAGLAAAKARGVKLGRSRDTLTEELFDAVQADIAAGMSAAAACRAHGVARATYYKRLATDRASTDDLPP